MAKEKIDTKAKPAAKDEAETFKYGVSDIAEKMGIDASAVRVKLRNAGIEKSGKSYGWNTKTDLNEAIDEITTAKKVKAEAKPAKADAKPAAKGKVKPAPAEDEKPVKKPKAKKPKDDEDDD